MEDLHSLLKLQLQQHFGETFTIPEQWRDFIEEVSKTYRQTDLLRYLGFHDPLTKLYNRAYFEEEFHRFAISRYKSVGLIMCDLDGLKLVNDSLGHHWGDIMLKSAAGVIKGVFRKCDVVARVGGDEFAVLIPSPDQAALFEAEERVRRAVGQFNKADHELSLSISVGSALCSGEQKDIQRLYSEADQNMYRQKLQRCRRARNIIVQSLKKILERKEGIYPEDRLRLQQLIGLAASSLSLTGQTITRLYQLAEYRDIGMVGLPPALINKPEPLTASERAELSRHCEIGYRIAQSVPDLLPIADLIRKHHELPNGEGYPLHLKGEQIPLECRLLAIVGDYVQLTGHRPLGGPLSYEQAAAELLRGAGLYYDAELTYKFVGLLERERNRRQVLGC